MTSFKIKNIRDFMADQSLDALFITSPSNITYASEFIARLSSEREAYVLVTKKNAYIFTSKLYLEEVKNHSDCTPVELTTQNPLSKSLKELAEKEHAEKIGFEEENLTYAEYKKLSKQLPNLVPTDLYGVREIKDAEEIKKIARACDIGDKAFAYILSEIKIGITEKDLAIKLENFIRNNYAEISFPTIVAFGKNAAVPHHETNTTTLAKNQFVLLDFGVLFENYCSDMTRTVFFGSPTEKEKHAYETVKVAQGKAIGYIKNHCHSGALRQAQGKLAIESQQKKSYQSANASFQDDKGIKASEVDKIAREYITSQGYPSFPHSLGHGIGIEVHEAPSLSPYSSDTLLPGMVFSIEPGIYVDNHIGIRIEDLVAITDQGLVELTHAPKELIII